VANPDSTFWQLDDATVRRNDEYQRDSDGDDVLGAKALATPQRGVFIDDDTRLCEVLVELDRSGVRIALDDYGTGYSSLSYLAHLPIHILKIDGCFITDLAHDAGKIILASVTKLAHDLGLQVTAEGVETAAQHDIVDALGCDLVQGYLYARPMPAAATGSLLASRKALPTR